MTSEVEQGRKTEQWHYDPACDLDELERARLRLLLSAPNKLVSGLRSVSTAVIRCWLRLYHRLTISGREHLPAQRSFVMIANHASHLDTLCLLAALPFGQVHRAYPAAARDYFCVNALKSFMAAVVLNAIPFDRQFAPWQSLSACAGLLESPGNVLIFFPEGTRTCTAEPGDFKPGVALLAASRNIPVVPCHLAGTRGALPKGAWLPRPHAVRLTIGRPRYYSHLPATKESATEISRELRAAVMALGQAEAHR